MFAGVQDHANQRAKRGDASHARVHERQHLLGDEDDVGRRQRRHDHGESDVEVDQHDEKHEHDSIRRKSQRSGKISEYFFF